jgi:hypothetical protein
MNFIPNVCSLAKLYNSLEVQASVSYIKKRQIIKGIGKVVPLHGIKANRGREKYSSTHSQPWC